MFQFVFVILTSQWARAWMYTIFLVKQYHCYFNYEIREVNKPKHSEDVRLYLLIISETSEVNYIKPSENKRC